MNTENALFKTGELLSSMFINSEIKENPKFAVFCQTCLDKHKSGEWGDLGKDDLDANNFAVENEERIFSSYIIPKDLNMDEEKIYIITESDRSCTTILFPIEY